MKTIACGLGVLCSAYTALSCANFSGTGTRLNGGSVHTSRRTGVAVLRHALLRNPRPDGIHLETSLRGATNFNDRSDYSVALMYAGRSAEAVERLEQLEKEKPGEYFIAANLGTAYELSGKNAEALQWIREGIRRNPDSHQGTEWLHVRILEAKIAQQHDPDYLKQHSVLELSPQDIGQQLVFGEVKISTSQLAMAIEYQLGERLQFVKPPDPAVASLLFDYAALEAATRTLESARGVLQMALEYGYPADKVQPLLKVYDRRILVRNISGYAAYALIATTFLALLYLLYKRKIFVLSSRELKPA